MTTEELEKLVKTLEEQLNTLKDSVAVLQTQISDDFLEKLQDVQIDKTLSPLVIGDILQYGNDGKWHNVQPSSLGISGGGSGGSVTNLSGLSDVSIVSPKLGQVLTYDSASSKWINKDIEKESIIDPTSYLTKSEAAATYFKINGGTINGDVTIDGTLLVKEMITGEDNVLVHGGVTMYGE